MDLTHDTAQFLDATRRDGWTPALKARFCALLSENGNARLAARRCGLSAQSAYVHRRRDPVFARTWTAALMHARDHAEQVLADRAIEGVEEEIYYRGELVATRRKFDTRLLLAHLARLDRMAEEYDGGGEAERFDELLAMVAGEQVPEALMPEYEDEVLPAAREAHIGRVVERAERDARCAFDEQEEANEFAGLMLPGDPQKPEEPEENDPLDAWDAAISVARATAWSQATAEWDGWIERARAIADAVVRGLGESAAGREALPQDSVNASTSPPALPPRADIES